MLINAEEINDILFDAGTEVTNRGKKYFEQNRVKVADFNFVSENNYIAKAYVEGTYIYDISQKKKVPLKRTDRVKNGKIRREEIIY